MTGLRDRWRTEAGRALAETVMSSLLGQGTGESDLPVHNGLIDLRGFVAPRGRGVGPRDSQALSGVTLRGFDLSLAELPEWGFIDSTVEECRFDNAHFDGLRAWATRFQNCSFSGTVIDQATLAAPGTRRVRNSFVSVDLSAATLVDASITETDFQDCSFADTQLNGAQFRRCGLTDCRFSGMLREVVFDARTPHGEPVIPFIRVDMSRVQLDLVEFNGCEFVDCEFPADSGVIVVPHFKSVARSTLAALEQDDSDEADDLRAVIQQALQGPEISDNATFLIAKSDLEGFPSGDALVRLAERLLGAEPQTMGSSESS